MRVHHLKAHVTPNQPLLVSLPANVPEADVEVLVLFPDPAPAPGAAPFASLRDFDDWLRQLPPTGRDKADIDRQIADERASWS
jgi:hypothetical protein